MNGDEPGRKATTKHGAALQALFCSSSGKRNPDAKLSTVEVPEGEDVNSLAQSHEPEIFTHLIENRKSIPGLIPSTEKENRTTVPNPRTDQGQKVSLNTDNPEQITYTSECPAGVPVTATVWGGIEKENLSRLKISLHIKAEGKSFRDDVNLYSHAAVKKLIGNVSETLEISTALTTHTIEAYRVEERAAQLRALRPRQYEMTEKEVQVAEKFLQSPDLVKNTLNLISQSSLIGEQKNGLLLFFLYLSRFFDEPLFSTGYFIDQFLKGVSPGYKDFRDGMDLINQQYPERSYNHGIYVRFEAGTLIYNYSQGI